MIGRHSFLAILLLLLCAAAASAQDISVSAELSSTTTHISKPVMLHITVSVSNSDERYDVNPELPELPFMKAVPLNPREQYSETIINGRRSVTSKTTYRWQIQARKEGRLFIPPVTISIAGRNYTTRGLELTVTSGAVNTEEVEIEVDFDKGVLYKGQVVPVTFYLRFLQDVRQIRVLNCRVPVLRQEYARDVTTLIDLTPSGVNAQSVPVNDTTYEGFQSSVKKAGLTYHQITVTRYLEITKTGSYTVDRSVLSVEYYYNGRQKQAVEYTDPIDIQTRELPADSRPDNFTGIIGELEVTSRVIDSSVYKNTPFSFELTLSGPYFTSKPELPALGAFPGYDTGEFAFPEQASPGRYKQEDIVYTRSVIPRVEGELTLPPVVLSYFDPDSGSYRKAQSAAVVVDVLPESRRPDASIFIDGETVTNDIDRKGSKGILFNYSPESTAADTVMLDLRAGDSPVLLMLSVMPYVLLVVIVLFKIIARAAGSASHISLFRNDEKAAVQSLRALHAGEPRVFESIDSLLRSYLAAKKVPVNSADGPEEITAKLSGRVDNTTLIETAGGLFSDLENARFAGQGRGKPEEMTDRASDFVRMCGRLKL